MEKMIFDIAGMRCEACAIGIELALAKKKEFFKAIGSQSSLTFYFKAKNYS